MDTEVADAAQGILSLGKFLVNFFLSSVLFVAISSTKLLFTIVGALARDLTAKGASGGRPVIPSHDLAREGLDGLQGTAGRPDLGEPSYRAWTGGEGWLLPPVTLLSVSLFLCGEY